MTNPEFRPTEWLAGYADGELSPAAQDAISERVATDNDWAELLEGQLRLRPDHEDSLLVPPPVPSEAAWARTRSQISESLLQHKRRVDRRRLVRRKFYVGMILLILVGIGVSLETGTQPNVPRSVASDIPVQVVEEIPTAPQPRPRTVVVVAPGEPRLAAPQVELATVEEPRPQSESVVEETPRVEAPKTAAKVEEPQRMPVLVTKPSSSQGFAEPEKPKK